MIMRCLLLAFCFVWVCHPAGAQIKNIKITETSTAGQLLIAAKSNNPRQLMVTGTSFLSVSNDSGVTWHDRFDKKSVDSVLTANTRCKGPENEYYSAFVEGGDLKIRMENNYSSQAKTIAPFKNGQNYLISGRVQANGLPSVACDLSANGHFGRIYVCWSDEKYGATNKDVFLAYSDDKGASWTEPILVTYRPNHKEQFMPRLAVDQLTGFVYLVYYDLQNSAGGTFADVYLARSKNGGLLFDFFKLNETPVDLIDGGSLGDRTGLCVVNSVIRPVWVQPGEQKSRSRVFTALVDEAVLAAYTSSLHEPLVIEKTFPFSDKIAIDFDMTIKTPVSVLITKPLDHTFEKWIVKNKKVKKGHNHLLIDTRLLGLPKGSYTLTFYYDHKNTYVWLIDE